MSPDRLIRHVIGPPVRYGDDKMVAWYFPLPNKGERMRSLDLYSYGKGISRVTIWHENQPGDRGRMSVNTKNGDLIAAVVAILPPEDRAEFLARKMLS